MLTVSACYQLHSEEGREIFAAGRGWARAKAERTVRRPDFALAALVVGRGKCGHDSTPGAASRSSIRVRNSAITSAAILVV